MTEESNNSDTFLKIFIERIVLERATFDRNILTGAAILFLYTLHILNKPTDSLEYFDKIMAQPYFISCLSKLNRNYKFCEDIIGLSASEVLKYYKLDIALIKNKIGNNKDYMLLKLNSVEPGVTDYMPPFLLIDRKAWIN